MADRQRRSIRRRWDDLQPSKTMLVWSCVGSVIVALVVGFTWGGWVTGGTARDMAEAAGDTSRDELASVICVEDFLAASDSRAKLAELKAMDSSYRQRQFVEEGGWAIMPNMDKAARQATELCARVLAKLELEGTAEDVQAEAAPASAVQ